MGWSVVDTIEIKKYKQEWHKRKRAGLPTRAITASHFKRTPPTKPGHCKRCDILLEYAESGDEKHCGDCLNDLGIL